MVSPPQQWTSATFMDVSAFWSASDTDFKNLSSNFLDGRGRWSFPFDQQVTLSPENLSANFGWGVASTFWSANDTDFKNLSFNWLDGGCLCLLISKWHWHQKPKSQLNMWWCLHLGREHLLELLWMSPPFDKQVTLTSRTKVPTLWMGGCLCLLINKWHWLQKPKTQLKMWWCLHLGREHLLQHLWMSLPFDQQVTLTSKT